MNIFKLAEALRVDTTCKKEEILRIRNELGVGIETAREIIIEPRVLNQIKNLVDILLEKECEE